MPDPGPEWLVEEGIGEERAVRIERDRIVAARLYWPGRLAAGQIEDAVLVSRAGGSPRGAVRFASGEEALIDRLPQSASEGAALRCRVTRPALAERDRRKLARALPADEPVRAAPGLAQQLDGEGHSVAAVRSFPEGDWDELWLDAWRGVVAFGGGELVFHDTPAMTLVDIDGSGDARGLALEAVPALANALARFDIAGNIGIDFPTLGVKSDRKAVDEALEAALSNWPHERTAMNGFGFVQIVARFERLSLLQQLRQNRAGAALRLLLRKAETVTGPGALLLTMNPVLHHKLTPEWQAELACRTGRELRIATDPGLALEGGFSQAVPA